MSVVSAAWFEIVLYSSGIYICSYIMCVRTTKFIFVVS